MRLRALIIARFKTVRQRVAAPTRAWADWGAGGRTPRPSLSCMAGRQYTFTTGTTSGCSGENPYANRQWLALRCCLRPCWTQTALA